MYRSHYIVFFLLIGCSFSCRKKTLFESLPASHTGVHFVNKVEENDKYNVLDYMNIYTGAGVAADDVNNDGLPDLYFSGNETSGRLYINKGHCTFEDVTEKAGLLTNRWCTGVSMVDINQDGWLDLYVNVAGSPKFGSTANLLYINQKNGTFREEAAKWGIADTRLTMNASFFDYDHDGDLDLFLITNPADERVDNVNTIAEAGFKDQHVSGVDILYRNNGNETFTDVSAESGITKGGYSLGAAISDVNGDGWPDIYVSNDFLTSDILYINNRNGSFTDRIHECLKHTSFASMGNDIADINNDGLPDIYTLDMLPEDNYRKKMIIPAAGYDKFQLLLQNGYETQYTRNALQLNNGNGSFSDIAFLSGVAATDWSWAPLFADYDNDGDKDLLVTNGFYRDLGDQDYIHYQAKLMNPMGREDARRSDKLKAIKDLQKIPLLSYLFENNGDLTFTKRSTDWGFNEPGFSNGACYADLDNDGNLELVINQFNAEAKIFKNNAAMLLSNNYLSVRLTGHKPNLQAIGAKVFVYTKEKMQLEELNPYRGYESSVDPVLHFGLGKNKIADSILVIWPDGSRQTTYAVKANQRCRITQENNSEAAQANRVVTSVSSFQLFTNISGTNGLQYAHMENEFVDFKIQPLLPHMHSRNGPGMTAGDVNGDGLEDFFIGAASGSDGSFFLQNRLGGFTEKKLKKDTLYEDMGVLLFDADADNDLDLFVVSGGSEHAAGTATQQDRLYLNDGRGNFSLTPDALPDTRSSGSCVVACDYDKDGDMDLFIGGRVLPGSYPLPAQSYLLKNERGKFSDVSATELPQQGKMGMVTTALWTDYDNDGWTDLMIAGEFMPVSFVKNKQGKLDTRPLDLPHTSGWWNSITAGDFDEDGDIDYVVGNLGLNSRHKASVQEPLCIYAKDFDKNGRIDPVMCYYVQGKNMIYPTRDEMIRQIPAMRSRFQSYKEFADAGFEESFTKEELSDAYIVKSECLESSYFQNDGNGKFTRKSLPLQAQFAPVFGMLTGDYNHDGHMDVLLTGNSYATEVSTGNYDAMSGLLLAGDGKGSFSPAGAAATGFTANNDSKGMVDISLHGNGRAVLVAVNNGKMESYLSISTNEGAVQPGKDDVYAIIRKKDGGLYKQEVYCGSGYLSGSSGKIWLNTTAIASVIMYTKKGIGRTLVIK